MLEPRRPENWASSHSELTKDDSRLGKLWPRQAPGVEIKLYWNRSHTLVFRFAHSWLCSATVGLSSPQDLHSLQQFLSGPLQKSLLTPELEKSTDM